MTVLIFPILASGTRPDSSKYEESKKDPAMRAEMEGGYVVTRARTTRKPTRTFRVGYTELNNDDKVVLDAFYDTAQGGSLAFTWTNPESLTNYTVRFKGGFSFAYVGIGATKLWNCAFELEQV